jgi:hypothetical protein
MDVRQAPPRILYVATWIVVIGILGSLLWLMTVPPADYANYQPLFQAAFDLAFGSIFIACGLFYNSWFAIIMGAHNAPVILHFGPNRARIGYIISGVIFLALGVVGFLLHSR